METIIGLTIPFLGTALGASLVLMLRGGITEKTNSAMLGFASGVMLAASVWSLLLPAFNQAADLVRVPWIPVMGGFLLGSVFFYTLDIVLRQLTEDYIEYFFIY